MEDIQWVHPVQWGSLSASGCQILHRIDICDYMSCATRWFQHNAAIFKHVKGDELTLPQRGVSPGERERGCSCKFADTVSGCIDKWMHSESTAVVRNTFFKEVLFWFGFIKTHSMLSIS